MGENWWRRALAVLALAGALVGSSFTWNSAPAAEASTYRYGGVLYGSMEVYGGVGIRVCGTTGGGDVCRTVQPGQSSLDVGIRDANSWYVGPGYVAYVEVKDANGWHRPIGWFGPGTRPLGGSDHFAMARRG